MVPTSGQTKSYSGYTRGKFPRTMPALAQAITAIKMKENGALVRKTPFSGNFGLNDEG